MTASIGFLVFPRLQLLDFAGPCDVFAHWPEAEILLVGKSREPLRATSGVVLTPTTTFAECPRLDVVCVPGGVGVNPLIGDEETLAFLRARAAEARFVTSVCTGALVLGAAGLLVGKRATTHWAALDMLARFGAIAVEARVARDGKIVTGGGVTAGIDFALSLLEDLADRDVAEAVQLGLEYAPAPPFAAGSPKTARPEIVARVRAAAAGSRAERERLVRAWRG
jgi:cyclohexyl-isocyanide hydratase